MVTGLLGQVEGFAFEGESLGEAGLAEGVEDSIDGGAVAHRLPHPRLSQPGRPRTPLTPLWRGSVLGRAGRRPFRGLEGPPYALEWT